MEHNTMATTDMTPEQIEPAGADYQVADGLAAKEEAAQAGQVDTLVIPDGALYQDRLNALQETIAAKRNPFLNAASLLLRAIADMPKELVGDQAIKELHGMLATELITYTRLCDQVNLRRDHMLAVRFALCSALDEAVSLTAWGGGIGTQTGVWGTQPLLLQFHQETVGGEKVFLLLGRLAANSDEHINVLEVMLQILGLGFMGSYRTKPDGHRMIETIRHRLYSTLTASKGAVSRDLSQNWRGVAGGKFKVLRSIPVWVSASIAGLILLAMFTWYKFHLVRSTNAAESSIRDIIKYKPAPQARITLTSLLDAPIKAKQLDVDEHDKASFVTMHADDMFVAGKAEVSTNPKTTALLRQIASALKKVPGNIIITGHSDNQPIATPEFPSNVVLSKKRAQAVAKALTQEGVPANRIETAGAGDSQPIGENTTPTGRAKNRRVQIAVGSEVKL
jgi:type VI secretion system protein ImpK